MKTAMKNTKDTRSGRATPPLRDEAKIASILKDAEVRAEAEHQRLLESQSLYTGIATQTQTAVCGNQNLRPFPEIAAMKKRFDGTEGTDA